MRNAEREEGLKAEDRGTEDRGQKTDDRGQNSEVGMRPPARRVIGAYAPEGMRKLRA